MSHMPMPAGKYYVGDLCYVMTDEQWDEVCKLMFPYPDSGPNFNKAVHGFFRLNDGTEFCIYGTAYGDGVYVDGHGREYYVDSGTLGCVNTKRLKKSLIKKAPTSGSHVVEMRVDFQTAERDGQIRFGHVLIDTSSDD